MLENRFQRTTLTWLSYGLLAFHTFLQAMISACMPFLRPEFNLDYTRTSLYLSANALGMVLAGLSAGRLVALIGRRKLLYLSFSGSTIGVLFMALGRVAEIPLAGSLLCGFFGPLMMVLVQAFLSDIHGESKAVALSEANIVAGIGSLAAPLAVSAAVSAGLGWRGAPWFSLLFPLIAALVFWKTVLPESSHQQQGSTRARLPLAFWLMVVVMYLSVSAEWSVIFWSADFLEKVAGFSKTAAAACISAFFAVMVLARFVSSRLVRNFRAPTIVARCPGHRHFGRGRLLAGPVGNFTRGWVAHQQRGHFQSLPPIDDRDVQPLWRRHQHRQRPGYLCRRAGDFDSTLVFRQPRRQRGHPDRLRRGSGFAPPGNAGRSPCWPKVKPD